MSLNSVSQLGQQLGTQSKEQTQIKDQLSPNESDALVMLGSSDRQRMRFNTVKVTERNLISSTIWDFSMWDEPDSIWNEDYSQGFILGNAISGVLGENRLGDPGTDTEVVAVFNPDTIMRETFQNNKFIDEGETTALVSYV